MFSEYEGEVRRTTTIAIIHRFELAADGHVAVGENIKPATYLNELTAYLVDSLAVIHAKISCGLKVQRSPAGKPHQFDIALNLSFEASAGLDTIEVAVDVDPKENGRVQDGRPLLAGSAPARPSPLRSSASMNASSIRTILSTAT